MGKKILLIIFFTLALLITFNFISNKIEKKFNSPVQIKFSPPNSMRGIKKVVFVSELNGWTFSDKNYFMTKMPDKNEYYIKLKFPAGKTQYKFLILKNDNTKIWISDKKSKYRIPDGFGGYNSVFAQKTILPLKKVVNFFMRVLLLALIFYLLAQKIIFWLFYRPISFRMKLILIAVLINILGSAFYFFLFLSETNKTLSAMLIQQANYVFQSIKDRNLSDTAAAADALEKFISSPYQMKFIPTLSKTVPINNIAVFDQNNKLKFIVFNTAEKERVKNVYKLKTQQQFMEFATKNNWFPSKFLDAARPQLIAENKFTRITSAFKNKKYFLEKILINSEDLVYPINNREYVFWFFFNLDYINDFAKYSIGHFFLSVSLFLFTSVILMFFLSEPIKKIVVQLIDGINKVRAGKYNFKFSINSGDEFQKLGDTFNYMINELRHKENLLPFISKAAIEAARQKADAVSDIQLVTEKEMAIMFLDIAGFSDLSTKIPSKKLVAMLNDFYNEMGDILYSEGGVIDKFIGDAILAFFDAPEKSGVLNAINASKKILSALNNRTWSGIKLSVRIGIDYGPIILGEIGTSKSRHDFTCIGQIVNRSQRIQSKAATNTILLSAAAYTCVSSSVKFTKKFTAELKGFEKPVELYEI